MQLEFRGILLGVAWVPRKPIAEADAVTNDITHWPKGPNEVGSELASFSKVLPTLPEMGESFYSAMHTVNVEAPEELPKRLGLLNLIDLWDD